MQIEAIMHNMEEVGKYVSSSKKRFTWIFKSDGTTHTVVAVISFFSGKIKIILSGSTILDTDYNFDNVFQHSFNAGAVSGLLMVQNENCELRLNNKVFSHLLNASKSKSEFTFGRAEPLEYASSIARKLQSQPDGSKLKINIVKSQTGEKEKGLSMFQEFSSVGSSVQKNFEGGFSFQSFSKKAEPVKMSKPEVEKAPAKAPTPKKELDLLSDLLESGPAVPAAKPKEKEKESMDIFQLYNSQSSKPMTSVSSVSDAFTANFGPELGSSGIMASSIQMSSPFGSSLMGQSGMSFGGSLGREGLSDSALLGSSAFGGGSSLLGSSAMLGSGEGGSVFSSGVGGTKGSGGASKEVNLLDLL